MYNLKAEERETIISWCDDDDDKFFIYSSQQPIIRRLLKNPLFECKDKRYIKDSPYYPGPIALEGYLPLRALTIRKKLRTLTPEQKEAAGEKLRIYREEQKDDSKE